MRAAPLFSVRNLTALWMLGLVACSGSSEELIDELIALEEFRPGIATWYEATGAGHCGYDASPGDMDVAAMNAPQFAGSAVCGACAEVKGPQGSVRVRIVDSCPECREGHLDLSEEAFAKISPVSAGRVTTEWRLVSCSVAGPVRYRIKEGSSEYWTAIQVRNHLWPIQKLEYQKNGTWAQVKREPYNYFVEPSGMGRGPVRIRITSTNGQQLEDTLPEIKENKIFEGTAQFSPK